LRSDLQIRGEPADAQFFLEQRIDAVKGAAGFAPGDNEALCIAAQRKAVRTEFLEIQRRL